MIHCLAKLKEVFPVSGQQKTNGSPTLILIDGLSLIYRAHYAFIRNPLMTRDGFPTSAIFGFTRFLMKLMKDLNPSHAALTLDAGRETFRKKLFSGYKAHREEMPDELKSQIPLIVELAKNWGLKVFSMPGFEADDLIGTLAEKADEEGLKTVIITGDRDLLQLVSHHVTVIRTVKGLSKTRVYDEQAFQVEYGIEPRQFVDVKALSGDTSDNIPGVPGIGEKTALDLIRQFGSIDHVLQQIDAVKGEKRRLSIRNNIDTLKQARELCLIRRDVPLPTTVDDLLIEPANNQELAAILTRCELNSLKKEVAELFMTDESLFTKESPSRRLEPALVLTADDLEALRKTLITHDTFAFLPVIKDPRPRREECIGITMAVQPDRVWYIPLGHLYLGAPVQLSQETVLAGLKPILENPAKRMICFDYKLALRAMLAAGTRLGPPVFDVLLAAYLLAPSQRVYQPEELAKHYLCEHRVSVLDVPEPAVFLKKSNLLDETEVEQAGRFFGQRASDILGLWTELEQKLEQEKLSRLLTVIELPLSAVLADMETLGIRIDPSVLRDLSGQLTTKIKQLEEKIFKECNSRFNLNSPKQLAHVLYEKMQLPQLKSKPTTAADVLTELSSMGYEVADLILTYREAVKLKTTYLDSLPQEMLLHTTRIHTTFHQVVTATGRLSSASPNLQNIPVRGTLGKQVRKAFIPKDGWLFLSLDYSQIELRILAHITRDPRLISAFTTGEDIHLATATEIFEVQPEDVTPGMRREAKVVNFGILYGMSPYGLAQELRITLSRARDYIDRYFEKYPQVAKFSRDVVEQAKEAGYVSTLSGRKRFIPELAAKNRNTRAFGERIAINTPIQGTSADLIKKAMIEIHAALAKSDLKARMLLQIHDELLFELPPEELKPCVRLVEPIMRKAIKLDVPIVLDARCGKNWMELEKLDIKG